MFPTQRIMLNREKIWMMPGWISWDRISKSPPSTLGILPAVWRLGVSVLIYVCILSDGDVDFVVDDDVAFVKARGQFEFMVRGRKTKLFGNFPVEPVRRWPSGVLQASENQFFIYTYYGNAWLKKRANIKDGSGHLSPQGRYACSEFNDYLLTLFRPGRRDKDILRSSRIIKQFLFAVFRSCEFSFRFEFNQFIVS